MAGGDVGAHAGRDLLGAVSNHELFPLYQG